ncbi:MAG: NAD-dependent epimerase/dehydratase family protein [Roseiflexaceae bacterium]|nr:NAD-dependent epimerase/dehydratase family protein [Roseiflexaceae bacterium]
MDVLILGGTGLISTAITSQLLARGDQVTLFNRGKTPSRVPEGVVVIRGERDADEFEQQMQAAGRFDVVIDMICFTPEQAQRDLRAFAGRVGQLIFCSTVNVYTKPADRYPYTEDARREPIDDEYGTKKAQCEDIFLAAHQRGELPVTIIRPAHTYGEGGVIIHSLGWSTTYLDRIRKGKPIIVHGDGSSLWVPCHIDDVARAFVGACLNERTFGKAYHTTGEEWLTWNRYHELVAQALDAPAPTLVHIPSDLLVRISRERAWTTYNNFSGNTIFDNSAAKAELGFRYSVPWVEGVRRTVAWLDAHGRVADSDQDGFDDHVIAAWTRLCDQLLVETAALR